MSDREREACPECGTVEMVNATLPCCEWDAGRRAERERVVGIIRYKEHAYYRQRGKDIQNGDHLTSTISNALFKSYRELADRIEKGE